MRCYVYKSTRRADTYIYVAAPEQFEALPEGLREQLGELRFALEFDLSPHKRLAQADAAAVIAGLQASGYYLQLPPPPTTGY